MGHGFTDIDNIAYREEGGMPWHKIGTPIPNGKTAVEVVLDPANRLNHVHELRPMLAVMPDGSYVKVPGRKADVRLDTGATLGIVADDWQPVQILELAEFADSLAGPDAVAQVETVATLHGGQKVFIAMKMPNGFAIGEDVQKPFTLLTDGRGGTGSLSALFTNVRAVCENTETVANLALASEGARFIHRGDMKRKMEQARAILGLGAERFKQFEAEARAMAAIGVTKADATGFFQQSFAAVFGGMPDEDEARARWIARRDKRVAEWLALMEAPTQQVNGTKGTLFAALQCFTEWSDHVRGGAKRSIDDRLDANLYGGAAQDKRTVRKIALALAGANG